VLSSCNKDIAGPPDPPQKLVINRILFISNRDNPRSSQIYSMNPDGSDIRRITYPIDSITYLFAVWSPDLQKIAVVWNYLDIRRREFPMLSVIDTAGTLLYILCSTCYPAPPVWLPDGNEIAYTVPKSYSNVVPQIVATTIGGNTRQITNFGLRATPTIDTSAMPIRCNNQDLLIILRFDSTYYDSMNRKGSVRWGSMAEVDLSGNIIRTIFEDKKKELLVADISRRSEIVFSYWRYGSITGLFLLAANGQPLYQLGDELFFLNDNLVYGNGNEWSPDGNEIAFSVIQEGRTRKGWVYSTDRAGKTIQLLTPDSSSVNEVVDWR
jgi:hypothetical protein